MGAIEKSKSHKRQEWFLHKYLSGETMSYKQIFAILLPIIVDQGFMVVMSLLNTAMISSSGVAAVSAVSMVDSINLFVVSVFIAIATGGTVIVAQYKGRGDHKNIMKATSQAISSVGIISIIVSAIILLLNEQTLQLLFGQAEEEVFRNAKIYLIGSVLSYPLIALFQAVNSVLRGISETKASLFLSVTMNMVFLLLNIVFIKWLGMGVLGLVISLISARLFGMLIAFFYLLKINHTLHFKLRQLTFIDYSIIKKIMFIGFPFALEQMFFNGGKLVTQTFIVQLGTNALTVNAICNSISTLLQMVGSALSIGIVTIVGQSIGSKHIADARKFTKSIILISTLVYVIIGIIVTPFLPALISLFSPPEEIVKDIMQVMILMVISQPLLWSLSFIMPSALRAAGDSKFTSISSLLSMWLFRISLGYVLGIVLGYGILGVWIAMVSEWGVRSIIFAMRFRGQKWYQHKII